MNEKTKEALRDEEFELLQTVCEQGAADASKVPTAEELQKEVFGPVVRIPQMVIDALNAIREAGIALESRIDVLEATTDNISETTEREILYAMIEDNSKELSGFSQQIHGLRVQLQKFMGEFA